MGDHGGGRVKVLGVCGVGGAHQDAEMSTAR